MIEITKILLLVAIIGWLTVISINTRDMILTLKENNQELKIISKSFQAINEPLGKAINMEYKK